MSERLTEARPRPRVKTMRDVADKAVRTMLETSIVLLERQAALEHELATCKLALRNAGIDDIIKQTKPTFEVAPDDDGRAAEMLAFLAKLK
jgi:hypothetical protein